MKDYENENWNDDYRDDIEFQGMPLIRQGQSNSPKVLEGVLGIGDWLLPTGTVAKGCFQFVAIGCDDLWVHWGANRSGLLGFLPGSETPKDAAWLKPGLKKEGFPSVIKEGRYSVDGSVWERTVYLHSLVVAVGRPAIRLERPICGTFPFRSRALKIGQSFYRSQLKTVEAVIDGKVVRNMTLGLFEMSSQIARERSYTWMAPKPTLGKRETPRLCRGGSSSLTFPAVHQRSSNVSSHSHERNFTDGRVREPKPHDLGLQISCCLHSEMSTQDTVSGVAPAFG